MKLRHFRTACALSFLSIPSLVSAQSLSSSAFEGYVTSPSITTGANITLRVSLPDGVIDRNTVLTVENEGESTNEFNIEVLKLTNASGSRFVPGVISNDTAYGIDGNGEGSGLGTLGYHAPFIGVAEPSWPWQGQDYVLEDPDGNLSSGVYSIKLCLNALETAGDNDGHCNDSASKQEYYSSLIVRPAANSTRKILLVDDYLHTAATSNFSIGSILNTSNAKPLAHPMPEGSNRYFLETAAWLERKGYDFDVMSALDIESGITDNYDVVLFAGENSVWTEAMRTAFTNYVVQAGKSAMLLSGQMQYYSASVNGQALSLPTALGDTSSSILNYTQGGYANNKGYTVIAPNHWAFSGLEFNLNDTFGEPSDTIPNGIVGPNVDGADFNPINSTHNRFAVGSTSYEVLAYASASNGYALPGMYRYNTTGGWVFHAASSRWASGLTNRNSGYALSDATVSLITENILDTFLAGGPADRDNDGIIDTDDNCPDTVNTDQANSGNNAIGDACYVAPVVTPEIDESADTDTDTDTDTDNINNNETENQESTATTSGGGTIGWLFGLISIGVLIRRKWVN